MRFLKNFLKYPIFNDKEQTRRAHFLHLMLLFSIPVSLLTTTLSIIMGWTEGISSSLLGLLLFIVSFIFLKLKIFNASSILFLSTLLIVSLISAYFGGNIFDSTLYMVPILIIVSGLLLEGRLFILFSTNSLLLTVITTLLSWRNIHYLPDNTDFVGALILTTIFFIFTIVTTKILIQYLRDSINESKLNEEKFRTITDKLNLGIFTYTNDGNINYANDYFCKNMGYSRKELLAMPFINIIHPDHKQLVMERAKSRLKGEDVIDSYEIKVVYKDGSNHWIYLSASKVDVQEKTLGLGGIFDITRKKELEQQVLEERTQLEKAHKLESLGILAGGIAHDFNNLLTGILGNISLIKLYMDEKDNIKIDNSLKDIQQVVKRASELTNQLLTFSKGGSPILKVASLENIIRENTSFVLSGSNVDFKIQLESDLWHVNIDSGQISQVIQNLIINADQAMPDGGNIYIKLTNTFLSDNTIIPGKEVIEGEYVQIDIRDNGNGISKDIINKIFDPYFTTKQTGNGLGLATVYSIIEKHNGYIDIKSIQNRETVFSIFLPKAIKQIPERKNKNQKPQPKITAQSNKQRKILIMDDEKLVQKVAGEMFKSLNFEVDFTKQGQETLDKIKESILSDKKYDIVLLDLTIPGGMGGQGNNITNFRTGSRCLCNCYKRVFQRSNYGKLQTLRISRNPKKTIQYRRSHKTGR